MKKKNNRDPLLANEHQRFSLRKLNIGVVSVLLGTTFYLASSQPQAVKADTIPDDPEQTQIVQSVSTDSTDTVKHRSSTRSVSDATTGHKQAADTNSTIDNVATTDNAASTKPTDTTNSTASSNNGNATDATNAAASSNNGNATDATNAAASSGDTTVNQPAASSTSKTKPAVTAQAQDLPSNTVAAIQAVKDQISFDYDDATDTLTINAIHGTATIPEAPFGDNTTVELKNSLFGHGADYGDKVKHIKINGKIILQMNAASCLFARLHQLTDITGIENLDVSQATSLDGMFFDANLEQLDLSSFKTSNVTNMETLFASNKNLKSVNLANWDTHNAIDIGFMFQNCQSLTTIDLSSFNTSKVKSMRMLFGYCYNLTNLNISNFTTSSATDLGYIFANCRKLTKLDLSQFDTQHAVNMDGMFSGCTALTDLNISSFNTSKAEDFDQMFKDCPNLPNLDLSHFDTQNGTDFHDMFSGCNFTKLDISNFDMRKADRIDDMLFNMPMLKILVLGKNNKLYMTSYFGDSRLNNLGMWFKKGTGTLTEPMYYLDPNTKKLSGVNSSTLIRDYSGTATDPTELGPDTYIRGYRYQLAFVDQDAKTDKNAPLVPNIVIRKILTNYPDGTEPENGLTVPITPEIKETIQKLQNKHYQLVNSVFGPNSDQTWSPTNDESRNSMANPENIKQITFKHQIRQDTETIQRKLIVHYVDDQGKSIATDNVQTRSFTRNTTTDLVTNDVQATDWVSDADTTAEVKVPVVKGYITDKTVIPSQKLTADKDVELTQIYHKVGNYVLVDKNGKAIVGTGKVAYENDPDDPTKIKEVLPTLTGYTPAKDTQLPTDPTKDTMVVMIKNNQTIIRFVDADNHNTEIAGVEPLTSSTEVGQTIKRPDKIEQILADLKTKGYDLVTDPFKDPVTAQEGEQVLNYVFKHRQTEKRTETITRKQIIHFTDRSGNKLANDQVTEVKFTRMGVKDTATGKIIWDAWSKAQTLPAVNVPVIKGYITDKTIIASQIINADKDLETTVIYQKLGNFVPVDQNGKQLPGSAKVPYENDPSDPTKAKLDQILPTINGYVTPKTPVPKDLTKDTPVTYLTATVPTSDTTTPVKPSDQVPDDTAEPEAPTEPPVTPEKPAIKPTKPVKPHPVEHKPVVNQTPTASGSHVASSSITAQTKTIPSMQTLKQAALLPQTGTKTNNQEALSIIALGFALISLSMTIKPKRRNDE